MLAEISHRRLKLKIGAKTTMKRTILLARLATTVPKHFVDIELSYQKGGMNYFTANSEARGYFLSVQPVEVDGNSISFMAFSGTKMLVLEAARFSDKKLTEVAKTAMQHPKYQELLQHVLTKGNITLVTEAAA